MTVAEFSVTTRPSYEGANIRSWIGFKHFEYSVADAIADLLAEAGFSQRILALSGVRAHIVGSRAVLTHVIECGDVVRAVLDSCRHVGGGRLAVNVSLFNDRAGARSLKGTYLVKVEDFYEDGLTGPLDAAKVLGAFPEGVLKPSASPRAGSLVTSGGVAAERLDSAFFMEWTVPYYYCESSRYLSYRGHVRSLESVVDDYLADVGLFIPDVLDDRAWIPVVSRYSVRVHQDIPMGAIATTHFVVDDIVGDLVFNASWANTFRTETGARIVAASGVIQHGYAHSRGEPAGTMARLDGETIARLKREVVDAIAN